MNRKNWTRGLVVLTLVFLLLTNTAKGYETIRPGAEGDAVRAMQSALASLGYSVSPDGKFGENTELAVKAFQKKEGLTTDGLAGNGTLTILYRKAPSFAPPRSSDGSEAQPPLANPPVTSPAAAGGTLYVATKNGGSLNLRNAAAYGQNTIAQIDNGEVVSVLSNHGKWTRVNYAGRNGYLLSEYLSASAPSTIPSQPTQGGQVVLPDNSQQNAQTMTVRTKNGGSLNLRNAAAYGQNIIGKIPQGAAVAVTSVKGIWAQVSFQGSAGYVLLQHLSKDAVAPVETAPQQAVNQNPPLNNVKAMVNTQNNRMLNFRNSPDNGMNIIGQIPARTLLSVLEKGEKYCKVDFHGQLGYVMTSYLNFDTVSAPEEPVTSNPVTGNPSNAVAFLRTLRFGDQGEDVSWLQTRLNALQFACAINGVFDEATRSALRAFQQNNGLNADGILGSQSSQVLQSSEARAANAPAQSYGTLKIDQTDGPDKAITALQNALSKLGFSLSVNGRFDIATYQAVLGFQENNGLSVTGIADPATQAALYSAQAKGNQAASAGIGASEGKGGNPGTGSVKLLHWFNDVKKSASAGQRVTVYHPGSNSSFTLRLYSMGRHADAEPLTLKDTQIMNRGFGAPSWNINIVYVKLPDGRWTLASMHNRPHLSGAISDNGFGGHLCVHFLRDTDEVNKNDPNYGADNQKAIRKAWKNMTGQDIP